MTLNRIVVSLILTLLLVGFRQAQAQVAFISDRGGEMDIYVFDADTSKIRRVTPPGEVEYGTVWTRDGKWLYFVRYKAGDQNIWRIHPDGTGLERVTSGSHARNLNDISPDGKRMLVNSKRETVQGDTYTMDIDGKNVRRITNNTLFEAGAAYSPDGRTIVVSIVVEPSKVSRGVGNADLFLLDLEGKELRRLTKTDSLFEALPSFSPDGKKLTYHGMKNGVPSGIFVMDLTSGRSRLLTPADKDSRWPRWSPDGAWIAYSRQEEKGTDIWIVRPDGTGGRALVVGPGRDEIAVFGPKPALIMK